jgi:uncharacterized protein YybS (DUF2232 family)
MYPGRFDSDEGEPAGFNLKNAYFSNSQIALPFFQHRPLFLIKLNLLPFHSSFFRLLLLVTFFLAASLIPFIGLFFLMILPLVLYVLFFLNDPGKTLMAFLSGLCLIAVILSMMHAVLPAFALAAVGFSGILMAWTARKNYSIEMVVLLPSLVLLGAIAFYFVYGGLQLSMNPWQMVENQMREAIELNMRLYSRLPLNPEEIQAIQDSKPAIIALFTRIFPALCVIAALFTVWINLIAAGPILRKHGIVLPELSALSEWSAPPWLVWIFIAAGAMSVLPQTYIRFPGINIFLVVSFLYLLQGLAIVSFFFQNKNISMFFRFLAYFLIAIQQMLMIAIAAVGFFNLWIDFRKYFRKDRTTE